jgi:hypothetical protein
MFTTDPKSYGRPATRKVIVTIAKYATSRVCSTRWWMWMIC